MRPIIKSIRNSATGTPLEFDPSRGAKHDLTNELGTFCSYCEKYVNRSSLHVEHIYGEKCRDMAGNLIYGHLKYRWDNFLLACVNCNSVKGNKDIAVLNPYMPHENNLLHFIEIDIGASVQIKPLVAGNEMLRTRAFIDLVGLDRTPGHPDYSDLDDRWENRLKVYDLANRQLAKYSLPNPTTDIENIIALAETNGYFSIWYYVFDAFDNVRQALISGINYNNGNMVIPFPNTHQGSFDMNNHFATLQRP